MEIFVTIIVCIGISVMAYLHGYRDGLIRKREMNLAKFKFQEEYLLELQKSDRDQFAHRYALALLDDITKDGK